MPLRRVREHRRRRSRRRRGEAVRLRAARPTPRRAVAAAADGAERALPRRRHEPRRPDEARRRRRPSALVDVSRLPTTTIEETADGGLRIGAAVRNSDLAAAPAVRERYPVLVAGAAGRRVGPAAQPRHGRRQPAPAHALLVLPGRHEAVQQARARLGLPGARGRPPQPRDPRPLASTASRPTRRTWPSRSPRSTPRARRAARTASARSPMPGLHRLPGDEPQRDTVLEPGELITAVELPPLALARALAPTARCATARRSRSRSSSVAVAVERRRRRSCRRAGSRFGGVAHVPWRASAPRRRCAARRRPRSFARRRRRRARRRRSRCATTPSRCRSRATLLVRDARGAAPHDRRTPPRAPSARPLDARRGRARRSRARRATPSSTPVERRRLRVARAGDDRPRRRSPASTPRRRSRRPACSPSLCARATRRELGAGDDGELAVLQSPRVAYRGQIVAAVVAETPRGRARGRRARARRLRRRATTTSCCAPTTRALHARARSTRASRPTPSRATSTAACAGAPRRVDATYATPALAQQPDGAARDARASWEGGELTLYDSNQGAPARAATLAQVFGLEPEHVRVISPARRRRLRLQGHAAPARGARRAGRQGRRPPGQARGHAPADVRVRRLPHADDPARAARRRRRRPADRDRATRRRAELDGPRVRRADRGRRRA